MNFEGPIDEKAIKVVMDREQAMDQKASDGSGINRTSDNRSRSNRSSHNNVLLIIMSKIDSILK
jgi:hypothetical protein